jgi:signal transduction histidine kinase
MDLSSLTPSKILVIEGRNESVNLTDSLRAKEYLALITSVSDPRIGLETLEQEGFDIIVLDCDLEAVGGTDFFRSLLLNENEPRSIAVLVDPSIEEMHKLQAAGCSLCLDRKKDWSKELASHVVRISRQKRAEAAQALARAKQMELNRFLSDKSKRLEEFSMTIAHDVRGPLGGIAMNLEYVLDTYSDALPGRSAELISKALKASERLTGLVNEMYQFARLGSQASKMGIVCIDELVSEVISDLRDVYHSRKITFQISRLPKVWGNKDLLRRVFLNLVSNSVKYNDKDEVIIKIFHEGSQERMLGHYQNIVVADNGRGIKKEDQADIFSMFDRGSQDKLTDGLGVGLAVVHRIVELHLGSISVQSSSENGTEFMIALPTEKVSGLL